MNNQNLVNQVIYNQAVQMPHITNSERLGVQSAYTEFSCLANEQNLYIPAPFNDPARMRLAIHCALREIDSIQAVGVNQAAIQQSEQYMHRIAAVAYRGGLNQNMASLGQQPFDTILFFLNLVAFLLRFLNR
jgi:hypothetical protein